MVYDEENPYRVFVHTVSPPAWEMITGVVCPVTSITPDLYKFYEYPWSDSYNECFSTVRHRGPFSRVRSVFKRDNASPPSYNVIDPNSPPNCARHSKCKGTCVARPCSHAACSECVSQSIKKGSKCIVCAKGVQKYVGFDKPVPTVKPEEGTEEIDGVLNGGSTTVTLMLAEDGVSSLHGRT
ncbi:Ubiquitin-like domain-containing protein [Mycena sanguinolenta]|uniref:Ubiquitin-like domain-containing protein n=1 Tax=Mycena sanguinolenta TaxID=230812 RepID=A0A8H7DC32_9AGAR|nr:Ubiquitin-like domain-containing protein [Mycena sanguinolenta]